MTTKKIKFYELPKQIPELEFDGEETALRLDDINRYSWNAKTKKIYESIESKIDAIEFKGKGWSIHCWCDVSGFNYWHKIMQEENYIQITIAFDTDEIEESEVNKIRNALWDAEYKCEELQGLHN